MGDLKRETAQAVLDYWEPRDVVMIRLNKDDPSHYSHWLADIWAQKQDFVLIEQDIVIRADVTESFLSCPEPWCLFPYAWLTEVGPALGCSRFRAEFLTQFPDAMRKVLQHNVSWRQMDVVLMRHVLAREYGQQPHVHLPPVEHLNPRKQLSPDADPTPKLTVPLR